MAPSLPGRVDIGYYFGSQPPEKAALPVSEESPGSGPDRPHASHFGRAVTISDVAAEARVARSTVSRALNNPGRLNVSTQQHIQAVAERLGYHPNAVARALGTHRTQTLALLLPNISNQFFFGVIRGAEEQAAAAGYTLILADSKGDPEQEISSINRLTGAVDGFILVAARMPQGQLQRVAGTHRVAIVNRQVLGLASVVVDPTMGGTHAVDHLASLGHRRVAYLGSAPRQNWMNVRRWKAIRSRGADLGLSVHLLGPFTPAQHAGAAAADAAVADGASAVIAFNDLMAIGVLQRLAERGVAVPDDVSVIGFDDIFGSEFCAPSLTTLSSPMEEVGRAAVRLLLEPAGARSHSVVLPTHLVIRNSTGPARV
jgi:LacI family transcriptional regulator